MGEVIKGIVQAVETKQVAGGKTAYNLVIGGQRYGAGLYAPKCREGDYVQFEVDDSRGFKNVGRNTLKVSAGKPPAEAVAEAAESMPTKTADGGVRTKNDEAKAKADAAKQETISRQSALNSAIAYLTVAQAADALGLPKADTKGKRIETLDMLVSKYTQMFYEQSTGQKWKGTSIAEVGEDTEQEAPAADDAAEADGPWE